MESKTPIWAEILSSLFLLFIFLCNLIGMYFITDGDYIISIAVSLLVTVLYYFIVNSLKKNKQYMYDNKYMDFRSLLFLLYIGLFAGSFVMMVHFLNVQKNGKPIIQQDADQHLNTLISHASKFDTIADSALKTYGGAVTQKLTSYKITQSGVLKNELMNPPFQLAEIALATPASINVVEMTDTVLQPYRQNIEKSKEVVQDKVLQDAELHKQNFQSWNLLSIMNNYSSLNDYLNDKYTLLNNQIKDLPGNIPPVNHAPANTKVDFSSPVKFAATHKPDYLIPLIAMLLIHLFIMLPFFATPVKSKGIEIIGPGAKEF